MLKNFRLPAGVPAWPQGAKPTAFWLQLVIFGLALLDLLALLLYVFPPGGSREELSAQLASQREQISQTRIAIARLERVSAQVETAGRQAVDFTAAHFLPRRTAYVQVLGELQQLSKKANLNDRGAVTSAEPIEGTPDLTLLSLVGNYEGSYPDLLRFLNEVDQARGLLILDSLSATPQQTGGRLNVAVRIQTVMQEDGTAAVGGGGQP